MKLLISGYNRKIFKSKLILCPKGDLISYEVVQSLDDKFPHKEGQNLRFDEVAAEVVAQSFSKLCDDYLRSGGCDANLIGQIEYALNDEELSNLVNSEPTEKIKFVSDKHKEKLGDYMKNGRLTKEFIDHAKEYAQLQTIKKNMLFLREIEGEELIPGIQSYWIFTYDPKPIPSLRDAFGPISNTWIDSIESNANEVKNLLGSINDDRPKYTVTIKSDLRFKLEITAIIP